MRQLTKTILLILVAVLYAGTAGAYTVSVVGDQAAETSDIISVDVTVNTDGSTAYSQAFYVTWDPAVLSPDVGSSVGYVPTAGMVYGSYYFTYYSYLTPGMGAMWIRNENLSAPIPQVDVLLATLVFHVIDLPASVNTEIVATFSDAVLTDYWLPYFNDNNAVNVGGSVITPGATIHGVPEPTTTMLMGLGLLGILYAGRRR